MFRRLGIPVTLLLTSLGDPVCRPAYREALLTYLRGLGDGTFASIVLTTPTDVDLATAARIEVLRGPFSSMYGNASGGVIVVETEDPPARPVVGADFSYGSYDTWRAGVRLGGYNTLSDENLKLVERFRRIADDTLEYTFTVDNPTMWTKPWTAAAVCASACRISFARSSVCSASCHRKYPTSWIRNG